MNPITPTPPFSCVSAELQAILEELHAIRQLFTAQLIEMKAVATQTATTGVPLPESQPLRSSAGSAPNGSFDK